MVVTHFIWHIFRKGMAYGYVEIDPGLLLLDQGEAEGYYYSGCYLTEFDFTLAPLWLMDRGMYEMPVQIHNTKDLYEALERLSPDFRAMSLDELGIFE